MLTLNEKGCNIAATQKSVCQFFCDVLLAKRETYLHDLNVKYDLKCYMQFCMQEKLCRAAGFRQDIYGTLILKTTQ